MAANIFDYIKSYCKSNGIGDGYALKSRVLTKDHLVTPLSFAPGIAFFYRLSCSGIIENVSNIGESFLEVSTLTDFFDYSKIAEIKDFGAIQQASSDFIFVCDNMMYPKLHEGDNALFKNIFNIQLFYMFLSTAKGTGSNQQEIEIEINQQNI